jgi:hypothetical protein
MVIIDMEIQNVGYSLSILEYMNFVEGLLIAESVMVYPLRMKKRYIPRYPYLNISLRMGKCIMDKLSAACPLNV